MAERFDVFISYSRQADEPLAEALQHDLQRFAKRAFQRRALKVFRDDANLSANPGLWSSIEQALDASTFLLLLASPAAAASPWVAKEIGHWRATQPAGHVLLAVTEGEVIWDETRSDFDMDRSSAIPPALAGAFEEEPRFVDLRAVDESQVSSSRDPVLAGAVADLAAPVHGRSKDELVGADLHEHRRLIRLTRAAVAVLAVLLVAALVAGLLAFLQRNRAQTSAADAEYRRLANAAATARTRLDALALSVAALPAADRAGRPESESLRPVIGALARDDLPVLRLAGRAPRQDSTGERQGVDASLDGTTLAYITNAGDIDIWDLTGMRRSATIAATEAGGVPYQLGLSRDGAQIAVVSYPRGAIPGLDPVAATLTTFDLGRHEPERRWSGSVTLLTAAAVAFGPDEDTVLVMEQESTLVVARQQRGDLASVRLGAAGLTCSACRTVTAFSVDGHRACSVDEEKVQVYEVDPPAAVALARSTLTSNTSKTAPADASFSDVGCLPEPCGASTDTFLAAVSGPGLHCFEPDGTDVTGADPSLPSGVYAGLLEVTPAVTNFGWRVEPVTTEDGVPLAVVTPPSDLAAVIDLGTVNGLMGSRLVRVRDGVGLLTADDDGLIELWSTADGSLAPSSFDEVGDDDTTLLAVAGPAGRAGDLVLQVDSGSPDGPADLIAVATGDHVAAWDRSPVPRFAGATGAPVAVRQTADGAILEVLDDGTVLRRGADGHASTLAVVPVGKPIAPDEVDLTDARIAVLDGSNALVADLADGHLVARFPVTGDSCSGGPYLPKEGTFVDLSDDGQSLGVVRCAEGGTASLSLAKAIDDGRLSAPVALRYVEPSNVAVADGGAVAAVAFVTGQVALLRDGRSIEPDALQAERAAHNSYQRGWVALDPAGTLVITRRDAANVELWAISGRTVERVAELADDDSSEPPALAQFTPGSAGVTIAWSSAGHYDTGTTTAVTATWDLTRPFLLAAACAELTAGVPAGAATQGVESIAGCPSPGE